jgi:hypothetical protein
MRDQPVPAAESVAGVNVAEMMRRSQACRQQALRLREQADRMDRRADEWIEAARKFNPLLIDGGDHA